MSVLVFPIPSLRLLCVLRRNFIVLKRMLGSNLCCLVIEISVVLFGLGLGLASFIGEVNGLPYMVYISSGLVAYTVSIAVAFEALDALHTRVSVQRTWNAMLLAPLSVADLLLGELVWTACKATVSSMVLLALAAVVGYLPWTGLPILVPVIFGASLSFTALTMCYTALCSSYDQHEYFYSVIQFPMIMLSGMWFPREVMPEYMQVITEYLPLTMLVELVRPLALGEIPANLPKLISYHVIMLVGCLWLAHKLFRRRLQL